MRPATASSCVALAVSLLAGCAGTPPGGDGPPSTSRDLSHVPDAIPRSEPRSRYGNPVHYEVFGQRYHVLPESRGYRERGVASWYGSKFHGRRTSSGEPFDMYAMTAAHKTLPLPAYARVTNLRNGSSIVVRINDRGPFVDNRLIDLSYAAAVRLDMVRDGTSLVEIEVIDSTPSATTGVTATELTAATQTLPSPTDVISPASGTRVADTASGRSAADDSRSAAAGRADAVSATATLSDSEPTDGGAVLYMQVGAFADANNASRMVRRLAGGGIAGVAVHNDSVATPPLYKVRVGPIASVGHYDSLVAQLRRIGLDKTHLVSD